MTLQDFKQWFSGFNDAVDNVPTPEQWAKLKERIVSLDDKPVREYVPCYPQPAYLPHVPYWSIVPPVALPAIEPYTITCKAVDVTIPPDNVNQFFVAGARTVGGRKAIVRAVSNAKVDKEI